jgi:hypothetical protein
MLFLYQSFFFKDSDNEEFETLGKYVDERKHVKNDGPSKKEQTSNNREESVALPMRKLFGNKRLNVKILPYFLSNFEMLTRQFHFDSNRLHSVFEKLSSQEIKSQRKASMNAFTRLSSVRSL